MMVAVGLTVPELAPQIRAQQTPEDVMKVVLRYFVDEGHPQPETILSWSPVMGIAFEAPPSRPELAVPRWGRPPPLNDDGELPPAARRPGRPPGSVPTSEATFFAILRLLIEENASARRIASVTDNDRELTFVNRNKAGRLKNWVDSNPRAARTALDRHEIPLGFRDTGGGVVFPKP